ncbi:patatin-like phospholipase family protein [Ramlibacter sp. AW1]|uniref:Patatin-like phospholipase family protein n=1 Tax=Ramlibacter aurantiacus TaxID=2801330 RepID=A0A937D5R6_9BURK|nr:patatin-like phospholipase family protein [Ramlibacter aurantiacus]MBL0421582.1 patatin-like phospholipase family protein [Ramlibacter aurantiacus]
MATRARKHIDLALQGGGAHGAFTWGVLERLLEDERIEIRGISGTSAGALNAVVLADGLMIAGRKGARQALSRFWSRVSNASGHVHSVAALFGHWPIEGSPLHFYLDWLGRSLGPQQLNPLDLNPLRDIVASEVNFDRVRACDKVRLFVSATNVRTGELKEFRQPQLSTDAVMASACLPLLFRPVEIDGEAYWDGGYVANPSLLPLVAESPAHDLVLVQINPSRRDALPLRVPDILDRINEITFNSSLVKELRTLTLLQRVLEQEGVPPAGGRATLFGQIARLKLHRIHADAELSRLGARSKVNTAWSFLTRLHGVGYQAACGWLDANFTHLGRRSTLRLPEPID